ncbi:META domain-containing protein [Helicobacter baculiformis]|uniref:META domain-containing protein n=1 Tax=Helicobacter baculiformis TaxID=427351 RepID=A0ABV7ZIV6_9HELI|nr:META domain-containing protein [Helicobacter baculiformis]
MREIRGVFGVISRSARLSLSLCFVALLLSGCFLVRFFSKNFNYNHYRIVRVVMDGQSFNVNDLILEALNPQPTPPVQPNPDTPSVTTPQNMPSTPPSTPTPQNKLDLLKAELETKLKNLNAQDLPPDASMIKNDIQRLQEDIARSRHTPKNSKLASAIANSPMGRVEFDQKQLRAYGTAYCNKYFISYAFRDDDHLRIEDKGISRRVCKNEKLMAFELAFYGHLQGLFTITRGKNTLVLDNQKMQIYLQH